MKTNQLGINLIKQFESLVLKAYRCPTGKLTIGYGHTGKDVTEGLCISHIQAEQLFKKDLEKFEREVKVLLKVHVNEYQFSALVSFAFNVGISNLAGSTLIRKVNAGLMREASREFERWVFGDVKGRKTILPGLVTRRIFERDLFLFGETKTV